jgi:hypothetical protein
VLGGKPSRMLTNAQGLTWIGADPGASRVLFSIWLDERPRMALFSSTEARADLRRVYLPEDVNGMVHRAYFLPIANRCFWLKWVWAGGRNAG